MTKSPIYPTVAAFTGREKGWRWPNFTPREVACKDGSIMIDTRAMDTLQKMRGLVGAPLVILSAYRSPRHNQKVGGAPRSRHMLGEAFDIAIGLHNPHNLEAAARAAGFTGIGRYESFIHVDIGPPREWGNPWTAPHPAEVAEVQAVADLQEVFRGKVQHPLKRKRAA